MLIESSVGRNKVAPLCKLSLESVSLLSFEMDFAQIPMKLTKGHPDEFAPFSKKLVHVWKMPRKNEILWKIPRNRRRINKRGQNQADECSEDENPIDFWSTIR
jgi:hypothetical protein